MLTISDAGVEAFLQLEPLAKVRENVVPAGFKPETRGAANGKHWIPDRRIRG